MVPEPFRGAVRGAVRSRGLFGGGFGVGFLGGVLLGVGFLGVGFLGVAFFVAAFHPVSQAMHDRSSIVLLVSHLAQRQSAVGRAEAGRFVAGREAAGLPGVLDVPLPWEVDAEPSLERPGDEGGLADGGGPDFFVEDPGEAVAPDDPSVSAGSGPGLMVRRAPPQIVQAVSAGPL
ncbi:hypothetical protein [Streptomyces lasiicapitis]|uniref:hypothetical protein n=1 Tax=Streptomyces lasiicapitis TaxID=1923961 RepID=UPI003656924A